MEMHSIKKPIDLNSSGSLHFNDERMLNDVCLKVIDINVINGGDCEI